MTLCHFPSFLKILHLDSLNNLATHYKEHLDRAYAIPIGDINEPFRQLVEIFRPETRLSNYSIHLDQVSFKDALAKQDTDYQNEKLNEFLQLKRKYTKSGQVPSVFGDQLGLKVQDMIPRQEDSEMEQETEVQMEVQMQKKVATDFGSFNQFPWVDLDLGDLQAGNSIYKPTKDGKTYTFYGKSFFKLADIAQNHKNINELYGKLEKIDRIFLSYNFAQTKVDEFPALGTLYSKPFSTYIYWNGNAYVLSPDEVSFYLDYKTANADCKFVLRDAADPEVQNSKFVWSDLSSNEILIHFSVMALNGAPMLFDLAFQNYLSAKAITEPAKVEEATEAFVKEVSKTTLGLKRTLLNSIAERTYLKNAGIEGMKINALFSLGSAETLEILAACGILKVSKNEEYAKNIPIQFKYICDSLKNLDAEDINFQLLVRLFTTIEEALDAIVTQNLPSGLGLITEAYESFFKIPNLINSYNELLNDPENLNQSPIFDNWNYLLFLLRKSSITPENFLALAKLATLMIDNFFADSTKHSHQSVQDQCQIVKDIWSSFKWNSLPSDPDYFRKLYTDKAVFDYLFQKRLSCRFFSGKYFWIECVPDLDYSHCLLYKSRSGFKSYCG